MNSALALGRFRPTLASVGGGVGRSCPPPCYVDPKRTAVECMSQVGQEERGNDFVTAKGFNVKITSFHRRGLSMLIVPSCWQSCFFEMRESL